MNSAWKEVNATKEQLRNVKIELANSTELYFGIQMSPEDLTNYALAAIVEVEKEQHQDNIEKLVILHNQNSNGKRLLLEIVEQYCSEFTTTYKEAREVKNKLDQLNELITKLREEFQTSQSATAKPRIKNIY
jgi:hypothetical protein